MFLTKAAIFFILDSACLLFLVFRRGIIPMFANGAFECNYVPHKVPSLYYLLFLFVYIAVQYVFIF